MRIARTILIVGMLGVVCRCIATGADKPKLAAPKPAVISVAPAKVKQTLEGFGASGCWWAQAVGTWPAEKRAKILELLFGKTGIGLTVYRHNLGGGIDKTIRDPWRRAACIETAPGKFDLTRDRAAITVLKEAVALGVSRVTLFVNSPPKRMTKNGLTYGDSTGRKPASNLRENAHSNFARYVAGATQAFLGAKIPVTAISPINEPQWPWDKPTQEGCHYSPAEAAAVLRRVSIEFTKRKLPVALEAPDSGNWANSYDYAKAIFAEKILNARIGQFATHSYFSSRKDKANFAAWLARDYPKKSIAMTEWCEMKKGRDVGIDSALVLAQAVIDDLQLGRACSWQYWIAVSKYRFHDGLIYVDERRQSHTPTKRLWALGQFSRFLRPGWRIVECIPIGKATTPALAAISPDGKTLAVVAVNSALAARPLSIRIASGNWQLSERWHTTDTQSLAKLPSGAPPTLPAKSVVTILYRSTATKKIAASKSKRLQ